MKWLKNVFLNERDGQFMNRGKGIAVISLMLCTGCIVADQSLPLVDPFPSCAQDVYAQALSQVLQPKCGSCHGVSQSPLFAVEDVGQAYQGAVFSGALEVMHIQATNNHCFNPGCNLNAGGEEAQKIASLKSQMSACDPATAGVSKKPLTQPKLAKQFRRASLRFCDRLPTLAESRSLLDAPNLATARQRYEDLLPNILTSACMKKPMTRYHRDLFQLGAENQDFSGYVRNRAAMLGAYLVAERKPYVELLSAKYCIKQDGSVTQNPADCITVDPATVQPQFAGIMTDPFLNYANYGNLHFRIMNFFSTRIMGQPYPDNDDAVNLDFNRLPQSVSCQDGSCPNQPVNFRNQEGQVCYDCHRHLNQRAGVFWVFNSRGKQMPTQQSVAPNGQFVNEEALQIDGAPVYRYYGVQINNIEDLSQEMIKNPKFYLATTRHMLNYADGAQVLLDKRLPSHEKHYAEILKANGGLVAEMLEAYLKSLDYLEQTE